MAILLLPFGLPSPELRRVAYRLGSVLVSEVLASGLRIGMSE
jgi:hypothetical protein